MICHILAEQSFLEINPNENSTKSFRNECNCLPACTSIDYHGEIDRVKFKWQPFIDDDGTKSFSKLTVVFRDHQVDTVKRIEMQTFTDFLAICGGLLGLFLGVSVLSVIEFIYFFTLRLYCTHRSRSPNVVTPMQRRDRNVVLINMDRD